MSITTPHNTNSPEPRRSLRTPAAAAVPLLVLATLSAGFSAPAHAADPDSVSFQYTGVIDATAAGGSAVTRARVTLRYSRWLLPIQDDGTFAEYTPLVNMIVELGDECISMSGPGTGIDVFNDAGEPASDAYAIFANEPAVTGKTLYGRDLTNIQVVLADSDATMFSSTALPMSADFAASADFSQTLIRLEGDSRRIFLVSKGAFEFSDYDPAGALAAIQADLAGLQLNPGVETSLQSWLTKAGGYITGTSSKSIAKAEQELRAFIAHVQRLSGKEIAAEDAARLITEATNLIDQLPACA